MFPYHGTNRTRNWFSDGSRLSDTLRYINFAKVALGLVVFRGPMNLCVCVREERGDGEGVGSSAYINLGEV
jgi:hypothetical protein